MEYLPDFSVLKTNRNFRLGYTGQFVSFAGSMITSVALPYQIYHLTHSLLLVGMLSLCQLIPLLFTALMGGVLADRHNRKQLLIFSELILAACCLVLTLNAGFSYQHVWVLFVIGALMSSLTGLHRPANTGMLQQIIDNKDFSAVSALNMLMYSVGAIVGPALGGLCIAHFGLSATYLIDFFTYVISLVTLMLMSPLPMPTEVAVVESVWISLKDGLRYAKSRQELMGSYLVDFLAMIFGMPTALFPAMAHAYGDVKVLGLLYAAPAVGALASVFVSHALTQRFKRYGLAISVSACAWGIAIILFGITSNLWLRLFFLALAGTADAVSGIFRSVLWNETIPTELRGRLAGIEMISYLSGPRLGDTEASIVASMFGITFSIVSGGALCVLTVVACSYYLPVYMRYRSVEVAEQAPS